MNDWNNPKISPLQQYIRQANEEYAQSFSCSSTLPMRAQKKLAILTCMDPRIDPLHLTGLSKGDAFIIRNAGGRASDDAIRSLVLSSKLLGTTEWMIIQHTDCGMQTLTDETIKTLFAESINAAHRDEKGSWCNKEKNNGSDEAHYIEWLTITNSLEKSVEMDMHRLRKHPLVSKDIAIYGYIYEAKSRRIIPVNV